MLEGTEDNFVILTDLSGPFMRSIYIELVHQFLNHFKMCYFFIFGCAGSLLPHKFFSSCGEQASPCSGFSQCGAWALEHRLSSCATWAWLFHSMWDLPRSGIEPMSPAPAGGFFLLQSHQESRES